VRSLLAIGALLALSTCLARAEDYRIKESDPLTGTLLRRDAARFSMPPDKTYDELSESDKSRLRNLYEQMEPGDEPPFPARGVGTLMRAMASVQRKLHVEGLVDIGVIVGPDGRANQVKVYSSPDPQLTTVVANVLMLEKYKPALCHGAPCTQEFPFRANFTLTR
jgi:hypothetical protein